MPTSDAIELKVADEVWIAAALLQREQPERTDFSIGEIKKRAEKETKSELRPGVYVHIVEHCVANRSPNRGRYRMLFETAPGRRRLFRSGDPYHPAREAAKTTPAREDLPEQYTDLLDWYRQWNNDNIEDRAKNDPLLALYGSGREIWSDEHADEYIRHLREGWE
jgi:hypothetical protein